MATLIEELLRQREGAGVDFKVDASSPRGIVKCFVALGNTAGGWIVVGVDDDRNVVGLDDPQGVEQTISNAIYNSTDPPQRPRITFATHEEKEVVLVDAQYFQGVEPLKLKEGEHRVVYERVGSNAVPVRDEGRLEQIRRERHGGAGFDQLPAVGATKRDLDFKALEAEFGEVEVEIDDAKLVSYELAVQQNDELVPTNAGILLFGKTPNGFLPDAYFRAIRYSGKDKAGDVIDSAEWPGIAPLAAIDQVEKFISRNSGTAQIVRGRRREEFPHYDGGVLREILHNAIGHADYSAEGLHFNVSIYSDRLVVDSPGRMPVGMSVEQLEEGISRVRNRAVMNVLHRLGYVEKHGTAYAKAVAAQGRGYPLPEWTEPGPILRVTLRPYGQSAAGAGEQVKRERRDRRSEILSLLEEGEKSPKELMDELGEISQRQVRRILRDLQQEGLVISNEATTTSPRRKYRLGGN
ncbi:MAG TPA: RNA-binding domain-containing protein [Solirubrobacterales bacterium]|nr:RNA-binding domain-containing protein [Solirubrobacterales bacterium]